MSPSISSPACRTARRLVSVPFSSRIGYRMIQQRNPSHAISDTTASASPNHLPAPSHCSTCFPPRFPLCFPPGVPPRLVLPNFSPRFQHVACQSHPPRPSHPSHSSHWLIALPHRMRRATSRRNGAHGGQSTTGKEERHDIRQLTDTANAPPRPPYSPYEPHDALTLPRTRQRENAPSTGITTPLTGNTR